MQTFPLKTTLVRMAVSIDFAMQHTRKKYENNFQNIPFLKQK